MNIEYHFYITYIIALRAGFDKETAYKIAYSSQYTDDNTDLDTVNKGQEDEYKNHISQTSDITKPKEFLVRIYPYFHFFPGSEKEIQIIANRKDNKTHPLNTILGNINAIALLKSALESNNPYRIGLATHTFVDTYAHQNFIGIRDDFNELDGLLAKINPINIGHSDAIRNPDLPGLEWDDNRLVPVESNIKNKDRFLAATAHAFDLYSENNLGELPADDLQNMKSTLITDIGIAIGEVSEYDGDGKKARKQRYFDLLGDDLVDDYDEENWLKESLDKVLEADDNDTTTPVPVIQRKLSWKDDKYKEKDWYKFQEAVKEHQKVAEVILKPTIDKLELFDVPW